MTAHAALWLAAIASRPSALPGGLVRQVTLCFNCGWTLLFVFITTFYACFLIVLTPHGADVLNRRSLLLTCENSPLFFPILVTAPFCWRVSHCNTQAWTMNLIHSFLCDDEDVTQARGCLRHETGRGFERWHCTIYCLAFCAGFNDAKRQHLSTINTNSNLSFTTIQKQTYRRKQWMDQSDDKFAHGTTDEKRANKVLWGRKYMHRKANRKTHSTNGVNVEPPVTYNAVWTRERFVPSQMAQWTVYYKALVAVCTYFSI